MAFTPQQTQILKDANERGGTITKKEIVEMYGRAYWHNGAKHLGDILSRMVKANLLKRVKPGVFEVGRERKTNPLLLQKINKRFFE